MASADQALTGNESFVFSSATLTADVHSWGNSPASNFGWLVRSQFVIQWQQFVVAGKSREGAG